MTAFVDTNILLYSISIVPREAAKRAMALALLERDDCVLSVQVLNEFVWRATQSRAPNGVPMATAKTLTSVWRRFAIVSLDEALFDSAWDVAARTNYSWLDCLIVAAARQAQCDLLYSEDMHHGHLIDDVRIENPFRDLD